MPNPTPASAPAAGASSGPLFGEVIFLRVFADHPVGGVLGHECGHRAAHTLEPLTRNAALVAIEEQRNHIAREDLVKIGAVGTVLLLHGIRVRILADGEAVGAVVAFAPPAV